MLRQEAAEERAEREAETRDARPDTDRLRQFGPREGCHQNRERQWVHQRGARALQRAEDDQLLCGLRQRTRHREPGEEHEADDKHALATEAIAELAAEQNQRRKHEDVRVDDPLQAALRRVQILLDRRQRDVHDGVVEHDHEQREAHRKQRQPHAAIAVWMLLGWRCVAHAGAPTEIATGVSPNGLSAMTAYWIMSLVGAGIVTRRLGGLALATLAGFVLRRDGNQTRRRHGPEDPIQAAAEQRLVEQCPVDHRDHDGHDRQRDRELLTELEALPLPNKTRWLLRICHTGRIRPRRW